MSFVKEVKTTTVTEKSQPNVNNVSVAVPVQYIPVQTTQENDGSRTITVEKKTTMPDGTVQISKQVKTFGAQEPVVFDDVELKMQQEIANRKSEGAPTAGH